LILDIPYPLPFRFLRRGIIWLYALRKATKPSREAARQPPPKIGKVLSGAQNGFAQSLELSTTIILSGILPTDSGARSAAENGINGALRAPN